MATLAVVYGGLTASQIFLNPRGFAVTLRSFNDLRPKNRIKGSLVDLLTPFLPLPKDPSAVYLRPPLFSRFVRERVAARFNWGVRESAHLVHPPKPRT